MSDEIDPAIREQVQVLNELIARENDGERVAIEIGPFTGYILVTLCQSGASREIIPGGTATEMMRAVSAQIEAAFEGTRTGEVFAEEWAKIEIALRRKRRNQN